MWAQKIESLKEEEAWDFREGIAKAQLSSCLNVKDDGEWWIVLGEGVPLSPLTTRQV